MVHATVDPNKESNNTKTQPVDLNKEMERTRNLECVTSEYDIRLWSAQCLHVYREIFITAINAQSLIDERVLPRIHPNLLIDGALCFYHALIVIPMRRICINSIVPYTLIKLQNIDHLLLATYCTALISLNAQAPFLNTFACFLIFYTIDLIWM